MKVDVTPLDPARLGAMPAGLRPDGNAYQVAMTYLPPGQPVGPLTRPGNVIMTVPEVTQMLLYSTDGRTWTRLATRNLSGPTSPDASFDQPGYYVGATDRIAGSSGIGDQVVAVAVITVILAGGLWFLPALKRRRRRHRR